MEVNSINIIDLSEATRNDYFTCLEDWSDDMKDGICRKECWYNTMQSKGLRVKLARLDEGTVAGMIHYIPIEHSWVEGENLYFVYCIWVHGHKKGRGDLRKRGVGKALLLAAEEDVKNLKRAMEGEDTAEIKRLSDVLTQSAQKLAAAMYQQASQAGAQQGAQGAGQSGASSPDDVIDADYREVA